VKPGDGPDRDLDREIAEALRRAGGEARPREGFRSALRERFVDGALYGRPAVPLLRRVLPLPGWVAYPVAAAVLVALAGAAREAVLRTPPVIEPPEVPPQTAALRVAEGEMRFIPAFAGQGFTRTVVEARPFLLAAGPSRTPPHIRSVAIGSSAVETLLGVEFPCLDAVGRPPAVTVVAPDRRAFEEIVAPRILPLEPTSSLVALALEPEGVVLVAPEVLETREETECLLDVLHETAHRWLRDRAGGETPLPLWVDEGMADTASQACQGVRTREWAAAILGQLRDSGFAPFDARAVLAQTGYGTMVLHARKSSPCEERPDVFVCVFHAQADSLVLFLKDRADGGARRRAFDAYLVRVFRGERMDPDATAKALGFDSPEALLEARDAWLGPGEPR